MKRILITGANKGLGFEATRQLTALGHRVWLGSRDKQRGEQAAQAAAARFVPLDVTDDASVAAAAEEIRQESGGLDVLINNAGIAAFPDGAGQTDADTFRNLFEVNLFGVVRVTQACLPLLQDGRLPVVINVSSGLGSLALVSDPARPEAAYSPVAYCSSKAALNMLTVQYAKSFPEIRFAAISPELAATDLTGFRGGPVESAVSAVVAAAVAEAGPTGIFAAADGPLPW
ncbi:SDR family NAD(P)-dependent oxidoreductase [Nocardia alni]|uniref:SDR family NAD(P)-dependent oxidoreductase n=1 Tax=Nocardia alni TaxID=2815723 RepID=UPI001C22D528|nr:SDR family NAD(P)-dependent oxidoreductase [Nocardia alni]